MSYPHNQQPQGYPSPTPALPPTNAMAIGSLITSLLGLGLIGVILGHIALGQIKRKGEGGRGLALGGVIIGWIQIVVGLLIFILAIIGIFGGIVTGNYTYSTSALFF